MIQPRSISARGFTLIEMAIVLVIVGLIVGGVLVGQNLIYASEVRATVSQIEKYNTAVNTFRGKYGALPGDMNSSIATQFGFTPRTGGAGMGDGNGVIEGHDTGYTNAGVCLLSGEIPMFWVDLTTANGLNLNLIDGGFNTASPTTWPSGIISGTYINQWMPEAKLGRGNYIYVWSGTQASNWFWAQNGINYFGIAMVENFNGGCTNNFTYGLTVQQAASIDRKMDDGYPQTGTVTALSLGVGPAGIAYAGTGTGAWSLGARDTSAQGSSPTTCFDNGGQAGTQQYSLEVNNGAGVNCFLSFRFQ